jgi:hypothetical protein
MLNFFGLTVASSTVLLLSISGIARSDIPSNRFVNSSVNNFNSSNFDDGTLFCYMQTGDGRMLDLTQLCGTNAGARPPSSVNSSISSIAPGSNLGGLRQVAESTGCFGLDAQGLPCPTTP